jgi:hypothetical protein
MLVTIGVKLLSLLLHWLLIVVSKQQRDCLFHSQAAHPQASFAGTLASLFLSARVPVCVSVVCTLRCLQDSVVIGARFDVDAAGEACRLAFYGRLVGSMGEGQPQQLRKLQVYKVRGQEMLH